MKKYFTFMLGLTALLSTKANASGGGGEGSGQGSAVDAAISAAYSNHSYTGQMTTGYSSYNSVTGQYTDYSVSISQNGISVSVNASTPFLLTWNGTHFVHENDFLFGKPNTAFSSYAEGLNAYDNGIGGDTYLLKNEVKADSEGNLKFQIREIEPEESYIDKFELSALDLKANEHFIVDGNLEDSYIFDTEKTVVPDQTLTHYHVKQNTFLKTDSAYRTLTPQTGESITLQTGDELILEIPTAKLNKDQDVYILVDSHYRDWTLGGSVPFSAFERFQIGSLALGRSTITTAAGVAIIATAVFAGATNPSALERLVKVPYTYADVPPPPPPPPPPADPCPICNLVFSSDDANSCQICRNNNGGSSGNWGGRSLVISAGDTLTQTYLQTLFPRYVQASQEVVRIPREIIENLKETLLTVRVKATKKHKVLAAFVFQGTATAPELRPLKLTSAVHRRTGQNHSEDLSVKNNTLLQTIPGDIVDITIKDVPLTPSTTRRYVLTTNGFYTKMSPTTKKMIGLKWLSRLLPEDQKLLKNLRLT